MQPLPSDADRPARALSACKGELDAIGPIHDGNLQGAEEFILTCTKHVQALLIQRDARLAGLRSDYQVWEALDPRHQFFDKLREAIEKSPPQDEDSSDATQGGNDDTTG